MSAPPEMLTMLNHLLNQTVETKQLGERLARTMTMLSGGLLAYLREVQAREDPGCEASPEEEARAIEIGEVVDTLADVAAFITVMHQNMEASCDAVIEMTLQEEDGFQNHA